MVRQMQMQQQVQQQAGHLMLMRIFLPSAPMGIPKPYKTDELMTDRPGAQQSGSQGPMEDANVT